jgi:hypothetical protein
MKIFFPWHTIPTRNVTQSSIPNFFLKIKVNTLQTRELFLIIKFILLKSTYALLHIFYIAYRSGLACLWLKATQAPTFSSRAEHR